ncbi:hypothetical protein ALNOE001_16760 [Candidatus Methanobinarius endosymbioticus]|uniref:Uncharacterized protein n=1 Tax=Candidatus Methanobinarius endosymbioticus TaxID=2006182 RepID=A0A366MAP3_9EURY|nr:hypothetical protein ALNOE001_16760 [Candidatus Methanobinarius endosymbioticus]
MNNHFKIFLVFILVLSAFAVVDSVAAKSFINVDMDVSEGTRGESSNFKIKVTNSNGTPVTAIVNIRGYYPDDDEFRIITENTNNDCTYIDVYKTGLQNRL